MIKSPQFKNKTESYICLLQVFCTNFVRPFTFLQVLKNNLFGYFRNCFCTLHLLYQKKQKYLVLEDKTICIREVLFHNRLVLGKLVFVTFRSSLLLQLHKIGTHSRLDKHRTRIVISLVLCFFCSSVILSIFTRNYL